MCAIVCVLVFEPVAICVSACECEYICLWACKNSISTHYSMEMHGPICLCVFVNMDVHTPTWCSVCRSVRSKNKHIVSMNTKLKMIQTRHCAINYLIENNVCSVCMSGTKKEWRKMEREPSESF